MPKCHVPIFLFVAAFMFVCFSLLPRPAFSLTYDSQVSSTSSFNLWDTAVEILYPTHNFWSLNYTDTDTGSATTSLPFLRAGIIDTALPGGAHLTIRGRKIIGIKHTRFNYFDPHTAEDKPTSTTEIEQRLQVQARGKIGEKISVNVDYDDAAPRVQQQKISLVYRGDRDEIIQEVSLGDISLALPKTHFTSYSKSLFGAKVRAKWQDFYFTGIASVTQGISEVKTFTGKTTTEERDIPDTAYIRRVYFKAFFDQPYPPDKFGNPPFSYTPGSLEVWIDDQDETTIISGVTVHMTVEGEGGEPYTGWFDRQYPGQDYVIDSQRGVLRFNKQIKEQYVIAVAYKDAGGTRHPASEYYMIMKGPDDKYFKYSFWNYYYLGSRKIDQEDFTFQIKDLAGNIVYDWERREEYPDFESRIDFDFGIAQIFASADADAYYRPFPQAYPPTSLHRYILYTKYIRSIDVYILRPDIVPGSEMVYVNGGLLTKDEDYIIDYPSGYLSFLNPDIIGADTEVRVEYEWAPILGGQATFLGARLEYRPSDNFSLGTTVLAQSAPVPGRMPALGSTPSSHQLWEADLDFKLNPNLGSLWGGDLPVELLFSGELSESNVNPNVFGAAMLEDFSASKQEDSLPLGKDNWMPGSNPVEDVDPLQEARNLGEILDEKVTGETVNPAWSSDEITVLILDYDFTEYDWGSAVYSLSPIGKDYSNMKYLEVWTRKLSDIDADDDVEVYLDIGLVSEDIDGDGDGDGVLDTEDKNRDGILNPGEDTGIILNIPNLPGEDGILYGAGNGRLDTEDLDGDGVLDTMEHFSTYLLSDEYREDIGTGWYKYTVPLEDVFSGSTPWNEVKSLVKHVRVWAEGSDWKGQLKFARISISGDRWQVEDLEIKGVNNYDDLDFPNPFDNTDFLTYYEKMFGNPRTWEGKWQKESALLLSLSESDAGSMEQTFVSKKSFSNYRQINFWMYIEEDEPQGELYLRFGSDVGVSYYEYILPLNSLSPGVWIQIEIPFSELESYGIPSFADINQLRVGLRDMSIFSLPYHVYINDMYLSEVYAQQGQAQRFFARSSFSNYFTLSTEYKKIDPPFSVVGGTSTDNVQDLKKWGVSSSFFDFFPFSYSRSEEYSSTPTIEGTDLTPLEKDRVLKETHSYNMALRLRNFPTLTFKGLNTTSDLLSSAPEESTFEDVYDLSLSYPVPLDFALLPTNIAAIFQLREAGKEVAEKFSKDITKKGSVTLPFRPLPNMVLRTSYAQSEINHLATGVDEVPKSRAKELALSSQLSIFGLIPRFEIKGGNTEEEFSSLDYEKRKVSTNFDTSLTLPFRPAAFVKLPDIFSTLGWYVSFGLKREGIYEDTSLALADFPAQFGFTRIDLPDGSEKLWLEKRTFSLRQTWNPFHFLTTSLSYGREEEDRTESYTPYKATVQSWPVAELRLNLNETPLLVDHLSKRFFSSSQLILGYSKKNTLKEQISTTNLHQPSLSWKGVFRKPENLSVTYSYSSSIKYETAFGTEISSEELSSTHKLRLDWAFRMPWGVRVPLVNRIINFRNQITLSSTLTRELKYHEAASGALQQDEEKWIFGTNISNKLTDNINVKLGLDFTSYQNRVKAGEDYFSYGGSTWVEILF